MTTVNFTKTGRVSKAKKGLDVHECDCERSYTQLEHLQRHQRNHAQDEEVLTCKWPSCGRAFLKVDHLQRHQARQYVLIKLWTMVYEQLTLSQYGARRDGKSNVLRC